MQVQHLPRYIVPYRRARSSKTQLAGSSPPSCLVLPWAGGPPLPSPSQPACSTHDATGKACHCSQVTFPVSAGQQSQKGKVRKVRKTGNAGHAGNAGKADPDFLFFYCFSRFLVLSSALLPL